LLQASLEYSRASRGLFNPLIGCLVAAWGFHRDDPASASIASPAEVERCLAGNPKAEDLSWRDGVLSSSNRLAQFDLGGVAKGYALNLAIERLRRRGLSDTIVNAGGDLCVAGSKAGQPWHIAIRHPQGKGVLAGLQVADSECVLTSGNYERYHEQQGVRYGHIIDPRTGYPAGQVASATVIAENGGLADAAATALSVAGPQQWQAVAKAMGLQQVLLVDEQGNVHMTRAMAERVGFTENPAKVLLADF
jgi:thiamine biosynthesis lipoprotein